MSAARSPGTAAGVDLFWLPLGAGDTSGLVRRSGRAYEAILGWREHRPRRPLFHSALAVQVDGSRYVVEMTPRWGQPPGDRGVAVEGPVGMRALGRLTHFRYEVHRREGGVIPDESSAVGGAQRLSVDPHRARALLDLVPDFPSRTWGRDEQQAGEMWNSNSLTSWLLCLSGHDVTLLAPPDRGRAPGWSAGLVVAARGKSQTPAIHFR